MYAHAGRVFMYACAPTVGYLLPLQHEMYLRILAEEQLAPHLDGLRPIQGRILFENARQSATTCTTRLRVNVC